MKITEIFVAPSLQQEIKEKLQDKVVVHSFDDLKSFPQKGAPASSPKKKRFTTFSCFFKKKSLEET